MIFVVFHQAIVRDCLTFARLNIGIVCECNSVLRYASSLRWSVENNSFIYLMSARRVPFKTPYSQFIKHIADERRHQTINSIATTIYEWAHRGLTYIYIWVAHTSSESEHKYTIYVLLSLATHHIILFVYQFDLVILCYVYFQLDLHNWISIIIVNKINNYIKCLSIAFENI